MLKRKKTFHEKFNNPLRNSLALRGEEGPINLVEFRRDKIIINDEAIKILKEIKNNIIIVSIFGKERTGKSYLMNLLLNSRENSNKSKGFTVSASMNTSSRSSRGIWMWNTPIEKSDSRETIIFIDSEGINSENIYNQQSDSKIFALVILMSSLFIYNTLGDINSNSLNELELIVHFADSFTVNNKINKEKLISELCPKFIWALRDFDLTKLTDEKGEKMTSDMYLEYCLNERFGGKNKDEINMIKENYMYYFNDRECVTLPSPVEEKNLYMLKDMKFNDLREDFQDEFNKLKDKIYKYSKSKMLNGKMINGPMIAYFLTSFIKEINNDEIPNISKIFNDMALYDIQYHYNYANILFDKKLEELKKDEFDIDIKEIYSIKYEVLKEYMKILEKNPDVYKKEIYLKPYLNMKEKLENEIEKRISQELSTLMSNNSFENLLTEKEKISIKNKKFQKSEQIIDFYLNELSGFKINSSASFLNNKTFDTFIKDDIQKTQNIIEFMEKNKELSTQRSYTAFNGEDKTRNRETNSNNFVSNSKEYETLKNELENTERISIELNDKYNHLIEARDKYKRKHSKEMKNNIRTYSNRLVNLYYKEENLCELSEEEGNCDSYKCGIGECEKCIIF